MFFTSQHQMALDVTAGIRHVIDKHRNEGRPEIVHIAHSAGGALLQYVLSEGLHSPADPKSDSQAYVIGRIALLGVIPCYGSIGIYWNWVKLDPFYPPPDVAPSFRTPAVAPFLDEANQARVLLRRVP